MARTLAEQLDDIDEAIERTLKALSIGKGDRNITRSNLKDLRGERNDILKRIAHETTHGRTLAEF